MSLAYVCSLSQDAPLQMPQPQKSVQEEPRESMKEKPRRGMGFQENLRKLWPTGLREQVLWTSVGEKLRTVSRFIYRGREGP